MSNINLYDQKKIPVMVLAQMKELREIEDKIQELEQLIERRNNLLNEIESIFPKENNAIAVQDGITIHWKMGRRQIGKADLEALEKIDPYLIRTIPEKVIPSERKAQTLRAIENWMEFNDVEEGVCDTVYKHLDIKQSKELVVERL